MDEDTQSQGNTFLATPVHDKGRLLPGGIVCHPRWKGSALTKAMQGKIRLCYEDEIGIVDFHPAPDAAVIYVTEGDLVAGTNYRRKLAKLRKAQKLRGIVLVDKTAMTEQYFLDVQKFVVMELEFVLLYVTSAEEAGKLLVQMVNEENKPYANPFFDKSHQKVSSLDQSVLATVQMIPKLGTIKAKALLQAFGSIHGISNATIEELTKVVGKASAQHVQQFLEEPTKGKR